MSNCLMSMCGVGVGCHQSLDVGDGCWIECLDVDVRSKVGAKVG